MVHKLQRPNVFQFYRVSLIFFSHVLNLILYYIILYKIFFSFFSLDKPSDQPGSSGERSSGEAGFQPLRAARLAETEEVSFLDYGPFAANCRRK